MDQILKKEETDESVTMAGCKGRSWQKQHHQQDKKMQQTRKTLPTRIASDTRKPVSETHLSCSSYTQHHKSGRHHRTHRMSKVRSTACYSTSNTYSLGARCGEIFVANNAKQWTFVCTFCNKSTRDIGDFICHIKIKHLEEPNQAPSQYKNRYYSEDDDDVHNDDNDDHGNNDDDDDDDDDDACSQARDGAHGSSFKFTSSEQKNIERTSSEYLDCGNYLDINVHTEPEELTYSNGDRHTDLRQSKSVKKLQNRSDKNDWGRPKPEQILESKQKRRASEKKGKNLQMTDDSEEAVQEKRRKCHKLSNIQQHRLSPNISKGAFHNGSSLADNTLDVKDEHDDASNSYEKQNEDESADEDYDNQLLLAPTDSIESSAPNSEGKVKRRQIRGTAYCALCNKTFQYYSLYRNHMIKHSNETPFKCSLCQKGFKSKQAIRYHMNTHQKEAKFKCEICETGFYAENQFITHVLTHESPNTYPCMVCGKVLQSEKERDAHLMAHTEERPFRCEFCHKLFRLRHHLSNHLKMHRQYRCEYCKEEFTSAVHLRKPYACPVCENSTEARTAAENALQQLNPMQLFEAVLPPTLPTECADFSGMVSDSDDADDDYNESDDNRDREEEEESLDQKEDGNDYEKQNDRDKSSNRTFPVKSQYKKKKAFPCKHCSRVYSNLSGLNFHIKTKH